jgi:hypothetical protein
VDVNITVGGNVQKLTGDFAFEQVTKQGGGSLVRFGAKERDARVHKRRHRTRQTHQWLRHVHLHRRRFRGVMSGAASVEPAGRHLSRRRSAWK